MIRGTHASFAVIDEPVVIRFLVINQSCGVRLCLRGACVSVVSDCRFIYGTGALIPEQKYQIPITDTKVFVITTAVRCLELQYCAMNVNAIVGKVTKQMNCSRAGGKGMLRMVDSLAASRSALGVRCKYEDGVTGRMPEASKSRDLVT